MKVDEPILRPENPEQAINEVERWIERVAKLLNNGLYALNVLTAAPTVSSMEVGEMKAGAATGAASAHEIFIKVNATTIARFIHDSTIT